MTVTVFYIGVTSSSLALLWLIVEYAIGDEEKFRLFNLSSSQLFLCVLAGIVNSLQLAFKVLAYQNERPGLITMIGYMGLFYGFLVDTIFMEEQFTGLEFLGVLVILSMNIAVIVVKQVKKRRDEEEAQAMQFEGPPR